MTVIDDRNGSVDPAAAPAWDEAHAAGLVDDLDRCVYASRLLGADPRLVLAGGGNSSVKVGGTDVFGDPVDVLHVKGSGWDMATIERPGFSPLRLDAVARLAELPELTDAAMADQLAVASLDPRAPAPSVESILHAVLPFRFVLHSHADAVLALTNTLDGPALVEEVYGSEVVVVPYVMPGFALARACAEMFPAEAHEGTRGMVLLNHGLFTFAYDARTAYENHVELVARAAARVEARVEERSGGAGAGAPARPEPGATGDAGGPDLVDEHLGDIGGFGTGDRTADEDRAAGVHHGPGGPDGGPGADDRLLSLARLRRDVADAAGAAVVLRPLEGARARGFVARGDLAAVAGVGPVTPDHVLRTKRVPLVGRDVGAYATAYADYVARHRSRLGDRAPVAVDPAPRVVLDPELGAYGVGRRPADASTAATIYDHTMWVIERAEDLGGYRSVGEADVFDVEYWELEQAKLARRPAPAPLTGRVALVTGAASGIGRATATALLEAGVAVVGLDIDGAVGAVGDPPAYAGVVGDATDPDGIDAAVATAVHTFGGLDLLVLNAGAFPPPAPVAELSLATWDGAAALGPRAALATLRAAHPFLRLSPVDAGVVVVGSKNVAAPGVGAVAYSAAKAALTQVARTTALEWAADGIRVNVVHPDAVFDTRLWSDDLVAERAAAYGLRPEEYRTRNLLGAEVTSTHVADAVVALCGPTFARTTGAQIPVDGGNDRVV